MLPKTRRHRTPVDKREEARDVSAQLNARSRHSTVCPYLRDVVVDVCPVLHLDRSLDDCEAHLNNVCG